MDERIDITCIVDTCRDSEKDGTRDFGEGKKRSVGVSKGWDRDWVFFSIEKWCRKKVSMLVFLTLGPS